jgi:hypothetical protein
MKKNSDEHNHGSELNNLLTAIADAANWFRHAEIVVQQRFYNFLMAESILLLAAAAVLASDSLISRRVFVGTLASVGIVLSIAWTILGIRQKKFVDLHMDIIENLERQIDSQYKVLRVATPIAELRRGTTNNPIDGTTITLSRNQLITRSSNLLWVGPIAFGIAFIVLLFLAFIGWNLSANDKQFNTKKAYDDIQLDYKQNKTNDYNVKIKEQDAINKVRTVKKKVK